MPPVQAGIVPAALPAFSAPIGVRSAPSFAACWADTPTDAAPAAARSPAPRMYFSFIVSAPESERVLDRGREEVAVGQLVVAARTEERGVRDVQLELRLVAREDADGRGLAAFDEVASRPGCRAVDVMRPHEPRREVPRADQAEVVEPERRAVAPGVGVRKAVERLDLAE